ncbi:hypothetical protein [Chryseobacterium shigense]|uniref:Uncharacterized protein n=1 Tax=Chryseobacterium shigense TaxID=297244 RepID=A0A841N4B8_9FLAO|nr:hypothetical protein [Chryseobacterium shigense]MBB6371317.1 hypothetical protein [Chryseobacterium shigense]
MYKQIVKDTNPKKIIIEKYMKEAGFLGLGYFFGDYKLQVTLTLDFEKKKITEVHKKKTTELFFKEITSIWVYKARFIEGDSLDYRVAVFLDKGTFFGLYVFEEPHFGRAFFEMLELQITGTNEPFRIHSFQEVDQRMKKPSGRK